MIRQDGEISLMAVIVTSVVLFSVLIVIGGGQLYYSNALYSAQAEKALSLAEAGVDKAVASLNATGGTYSGESETALGDGSYSVTITTKDAATKTVTATGYLPNKTSPKVKRSVKIDVARGVGVAFVYGIQVGEGGLQLGNSNTVTGTVYSNGSVSAGNTNTITGDVWVAGGPQGSPNQQTDCEGANCSDFIFGKNVGGEDRLDVAQSFQPQFGAPQASGVLNKVSIKIKKVGTPPDVTVRILSDNGGKPDKNGVLATGTLYSSLVTTNYGWIDVTFTSSPTLNNDTTYWLMIDTTADSSKYWVWQNDLAQSYSRGSPKWSPNWNTGNPSWNSFNGDLGFKIIMGGSATSVSGGNNFSIGGSVHANTISGANIAKDAYYQSISNSTVSGNSFPNSADPAPKVFPISEANIIEWKDLADGVDGANSRGPINGCVSTLDSVKVLGDVDFGSGCRITLKSPIWVTGNLTMNSNNIFTLDSSYGTASGVLVVDGKVTLNSNNHLNGTGQGSSLLMILSTHDSLASGLDDAVTVNSNGNTGVYYASKGIISPGTGNSFKELTAWGIKLINSSTINYETGLSSTLFSSGPSGSYSLVKGSYQIR